jgi:hypothetical protein
VIEEKIGSVALAAIHVFFLLSSVNYFLYIYIYTFSEISQFKLLAWTL